MLIDTPDGLMPLYKAKRACAYCGEWYVSSNKNVKTCSWSCGQKLSRPTPTHTCHGCGVRFKRAKQRFLYCTRECAWKHRDDLVSKWRHVSNAVVAWAASWSKCKACGNEHTTPGRHCSTECRQHNERVRAKEIYAQYIQTLPPLLCQVCGGAAPRRQGRVKWCNTCRPIQLKLTDKRVRRSTHHRRRARIKGVRYEKVDPYEIFARDGWRCRMCLRQVDLSLPVNHDLRPNLDHIVPLAKGGSHTRDNVQCLCRKCNIEKGDKVLIDKG